MTIRHPLPDFTLANPFYAGALVTVWVVDVDDFTASDVKATLFTGPYGATQTPNPVTLDGAGKWPRGVYCAQSVIMIIVLPGGAPTHQTGVIARPGYSHGDWVTATEYWPNDLVTHGDNDALYECQIPHTAGTFATDLAAGDWVLVVSPSGLGEAPEDGDPYGRQDADWVLVASDARMTSAEAAIASLTGGVSFIGNYNATAHTATYTTESGFSNGALIAASTAANRYVIVTTAGTGAAPAPVVSLSVGDWLISNGTAWYKVGVSASTLAASQVTITAISGIAATTVQAALAEISGDVTAEAATRAAAIIAEAAARAAADAAEATTRGNADTALTAAIAAKLSDAASDTFAYGRVDGAWAKVIKRNIRNVSGTADTPTSGDRDGVIYCLSNSATTITANDIEAGFSYSVQQRGTGQVTIAAGAGVTRVSDKSSPSYTTARRGAILTVTCDGAGNVYVVGNTA